MLDQMPLDRLTQRDAKGFSKLRGTYRQCPGTQVYPPAVFSQCAVTQNSISSLLPF